MLTVTPLYAVLLVILFILLSLYVVLGRFKYRVSVGDGGEKGLAKRMRVQANFVEYVPLTLILLIILELQDARDAVLHGLGAGLVLARICHAVGFGRTPQIVIIRRIGVIGTTAIMIISCALILQALAAN